MAAHSKMTPEEAIQQILQQHPEVTRESVLEKFNAERSKTGGFIADETLLRLIAAGYGVEIGGGHVYDSTLSIKQLVPSLNDVVVMGRVVAVYPVKTFEGKTSGKYTSLMVADGDSVVRVMLWNDKAGLVESGELKIGVVARFSHGYTREDRAGKVELHISEKSTVEVNPRDMKAEDYPSISKFAVKICDITASRRRIHVVGVVQKVFSSSTFTRQDLTAGKVLRFKLADDSGEITVVAWNEKAEELESSVNPGATVELVNAKAKTASNGGFEVHVDSFAYAGVSADNPQVNKIACLREGMRGVTVEGEVAVATVVKEVSTSQGETVKLAVFELKDDSGVVRVSAWREHAGAVGGLKVGERVRLADVYVKKGFSGELELSTKNATAVTML